jgi:uncharacterized coiled-coil DUF342 family protein
MMDESGIKESFEVKFKEFRDLPEQINNCRSELEKIVEQVSQRRSELEEMEKQIDQRSSELKEKEERLETLVIDSSFLSFMNLNYVIFIYIISFYF